MKAIRIFFACLLVCITNIVFAQHAHFITEGTILYQRSVNINGIIRKNTNQFSSVELNTYMDQFKAQQNQFRVLTGLLSFTKGKSLYAPNLGPGTNAGVGFLGYDPVLRQWNTVFTDFVAKQRITQKRVFEEQYLIKDVPPKIKWKIIDETRDIAGYTCRRANGVLMDSIYVVAFYTDQIHVPGGPELFSGLPGMILGVALPDENITWFASSVTEKAVPANVIVPPDKGKPVDNAGMRTALEATLKTQGIKAKAPYLIKATFLF